MFYAKSVKRIVVAFFLLFIFVNLNTSPSYASSTKPSDVNFPPVVYGPGFVLPDSPLYVFDKIKQQIRLLIAFSPQDKAKIHANIAGERLAELRIMFQRNNEEGIRVTLDEFAQELEDASQNLAVAKASGEEVSESAENINNILNVQRDILLQLAQETTGKLKGQVVLATATFNDAKDKVETSLPELIQQGETVKTLKIKALYNAALSLEHASIAKNAFKNLQSLKDSSVVVLTEEKALVPSSAKQPVKSVAGVNDVTLSSADSLEAAAQAFLVEIQNSK